MSKVVEVIELSSGSENEKEPNDADDIVFCGEKRGLRAFSKYGREGRNRNSGTASSSTANHIDSQEQRARESFVQNKNGPDKPGVPKTPSSINVKRPGTGPRVKNSVSSGKEILIAAKATLRQKRREKRKKLKQKQKQKNVPCGRAADSQGGHDYENHQNGAIPQSESQFENASGFQQLPFPSAGMPRPGRKMKKRNVLPIVKFPGTPATGSSNKPSSSVPDSGVLALPSEPHFVEDHIVKITDNAYWLLLTDRPVVIIGVARLQCFAGSVALSGSLLKPGSGQVVVPSLDCESWLSIHGVGDPVTSAMFETAAAKSFTKKDFKDCSWLLNKREGQISAVVLVSSTNTVSDPAIWYTCKMQPAVLPDLARDVFNDQLALSRLWGPHFRPFPGCRLLRDDPLEGNKACVPYLNFQLPFWKSVAMELNGFSGCFNPVIFLCGGKNAGKSTAVRFIINYFLRTHTVVQCLDCDIGQCELSTPGCLTLDTFTEPVIGAPFTRLRDPTVSSYIGQVSPASIKDHYIKCLEFVHSKGRMPEVPLIVNTMGWVEQVGLDLLKATADMVNPNLIIELTTRENPSVSLQLNRAPGGRVVCIASCSTTGALQRKFNPAAKRKLSVLTYLGRISPALSAVNDSPSYAVNLAVVAVFLSEKVPPSHVLVVLLGAYVGLSILDDSISDEMVDQLGPIRVLRQNPVCRCIGFGVVRGIDAEKQLLYVATPVTERNLRIVNVMIRGVITAPDEVFLKQNLAGYVGCTPKLP